MLKIHLRGTSRLSMFYFFDLWPDFLTELLSFRNFHQILAKKMHFVMYFWPFLAIFQASTLIFKYSGFFNPITCIHFLKALDVSFHLSYNSSVYHKNCGVNNFYTRLRLERHQDLRTRHIYLFVCIGGLTVCAGIRRRLRYSFQMKW